MNWIKYLQGGDIRSLARVDELVPLVKTQSDFDEVFQFLYSADELIVMRATDAVDKITASKPSFLASYKTDIIDLLHTAKDKRCKWHLALIVSRLDLSMEELGKVWMLLTSMVKNKKESRIVRVNAIQSLYDLAEKHQEL